MTAPSCARPPKALTSHVPPPGHRRPRSRTQSRYHSRPMPGPGSPPILTSHVSLFPSDHVTLTQTEYTQTIDTNTYPKLGYY